MAANLHTQRDLHTLDRRGQEMVEALVLDHNLPLGVIGTFRADHPLMRKLDADTLRASTAVGTLAMLVNGSTFHAEVCQLSREELAPLFGSSANPTGTGTRFMEAEMVNILFVGALTGCSARRSERRVASLTSEEQRRSAPALSLARDSSPRDQREIGHRTLQPVH